MGLAEYRRIGCRRHPSRGASLIRGTNRHQFHGRVVPVADRLGRFLVEAGLEARRLAAGAMFLDEDRFGHPTP